MHSVLHPFSPQAAGAAHLFWAMLAVGAFVWLAVVISMFMAIRAKGEADRPGKERGIAIAVGTSVAILLLFLGYDYVEGRAQGGNHDAGVTVDVTGHQWWWEVQYPAAVPKDLIVTANELHVPVGKLVQIRLLAADVIHSFWV